MATKVALALTKKRKASSAMPSSSSSSKPPRPKSKKPRLERRPKKAPGPDEVSSDYSDGPADGFGDSDGEDGGAPISTEPGRGSPTNGAAEDANDGDASEKAQNSKEAHAKQRQLARERKSGKPLADEVQRTKKIWERLRIKSKVPRDERRRLIDELYGIISGRIKDFVLKHDAVRAVQTAVKYGSPEQKKQVARELRGSYAQLAESRYAKFLLGKLMVEGDEDVRNMIVPEFYGKVKRLINHPEASWIIDDIYRSAASREQKAMILREWYGPEFSVLALNSNSADVEPPTGELSRILAADPSKRGPIMKHLFDMINSLVQKHMTGFTSLHDAMLQYFLNLKPGSDEAAEFAEVVRGDDAGDLLKNMAFTRSGARLACLLLAHGTAKDRKQLLKAYKDTFALMSGDQHGHAILLSAYDVVDDTKLTGKAIFPELLGESGDAVVQNVIAAAVNPYARTTLLYLLEGPTRALFPESLRADLDLLAEIHEIRETTSKKDPELRTRELRAAVSPHLIDAVAAGASTLVKSSFGCQFVTSVMLDAVGDKTRALESLAATAEGDPKGGGGGLDPLDQHVSRTPFGGRMLKAVTAGGKFDKATGRIRPVDPPLRFANVLYSKIKDRVVDWATGPSSFVVVSLVESADFGAGEELTRLLKENRKALEKAATGETGGATEVGRADGAKGKAGGKKPVGKAGNMGSRILLEKLG